MKERELTNKLTYLGAGVGIVMFAVFGLLPGSFLGGVTGLHIAGALLGKPVVAGMLPRIIVAASMVAGVMVSGLLFITASSLAGWLAAAVVNMVAAGKKELVPVEHKY